MEIAFLREDATGLPGAIGLAHAPGLRADLGHDLDLLREAHRCSMLVSLVSDVELGYLRIPDLAARAEERGMRVVRFPIGDFSTPDSLDDLRDLVETILAEVHAGRTAVIHCWAGLGRTGLVAASCLVARGLEPREAIAAVRARRPRSVENSDQ